MPRTARAALAAAIASVTGLASVAPADVVEIVASEDNTIYSAPANNSNGAGVGIFAGANARGALRRALVRFDLAGAVPPGATVGSAVLTLNLSMAISVDQTVSIHRLGASWGEAGSGGKGGGGGGGGGAPAEPGDATWLHRFFDTDFWAVEGGDFAPAASAAQIVGDFEALGPYDWGPSAGMTADVQAWLDDPGSNFGWIVVGNEAEVFTAKRFDSREHENPAVRPRLTIEFTPPVGVKGDANGDGFVDVDDLVAAILGWGPCPLGSGTCSGDVTGDGAVDLEDLLTIIENWT